MEEFFCVLVGIEYDEEKDILFQMKNLTVQSANQLNIQEDDECQDIYNDRRLYSYNSLIYLLVFSSMKDISHELNVNEEPFGMSPKPNYRYTCRGDFFQNSISPKKMIDDRLRLSIQRRMFRITKGAEQCKVFLAKSKFKPTGFKGGKVPVKQFNRRLVSLEQNHEKPKVLPDIKFMEQPQKKRYTVYSPKPNFVYNLSLYTKKNNYQSGHFSNLRHSTTNECVNFETRPIQTSEFRPKQFRNTKKLLRC